MSAPALAFSSREFLKMVESFGLSGNWGWNFSSKEYVWSSGMYRICGIPEGSLRPSYGLFLSLVHPDDRPDLEDASQILNQGILGEHAFRIIRPDGTMRSVLSRGDVYVTPDGQPTGAAGVLIDVTNQQNAAIALRKYNDRQRAVFEQSMVISWSWTSTGEMSHASGWCELTGLPPEDLRQHWARPIAERDREAVLRQFAQARETQARSLTLDFGVETATGKTVPFRALVVPVTVAPGAVREWTALVFPMNATNGGAQGGDATEVDRLIRGSQLRAARGLLDWTLADLAQASRLSLSTIRRLKEDADGPLARSRHAAVAALREAGISFFLMQDSAVAVAKGAE